MFGRSPLCGPAGLSRPCFVSAGLKCPPAVLKSGPSHFPTVWICIPCVPGGNCDTLTSTRTPPAVGTNVAVPIFTPVAFTMSACAVDAICTEDRIATVWAWPCARAGPHQPALNSATENTTTDRIPSGRNLNFHWLIAAPPPAHILPAYWAAASLLILTYRCASLFNAIGKEPDFLRRLILIFTFANLSLGKKIPERRSFTHLALRCFRYARCSTFTPSPSSSGTSFISPHLADRLPHQP